VVRKGGGKVCEQRCMETGEGEPLRESVFHHTQIGVRCTGQKTVPTDCGLEATESSLQGFQDKIRDAVSVVVGNLARRNGELSLVRHKGRVPFSGNREKVSVLLRDEYPGAALPVQRASVWVEWQSVRVQSGNANADQVIEKREPADSRVHGGGSVWAAAIAALGPARPSCGKAESASARIGSHDGDEQSESALARSSLLRRLPADSEGAEQASTLEERAEGSSSVRNPPIAAAGIGGRSMLGLEACMCFL